MNPSKKELRQFGLIWALILSVYGLWPMVMRGGEARFWATGLSLLFLLIVAIAPNILKGFHKVWLKFGEFMGNIISKVILTVVFFLLIFPMGLVLRLMGKDFLSKKMDKNAKSYWIKREKQPSSIKFQF